MYRCERCGVSTKKGEPLNKYVSEKRPKTYNYSIVETKKTIGGTIDIIPKKSQDIVLDKNQKIVREYSREGWEIVKELKLCVECIGEVNSGKTPV